MQKQKIIITEGLPASGKTTFANNLVNTDQTYVNINRDDFRAMLGDGFKKCNEDLITKIQIEAILAAIRSGRNVVVSDTNVRKRGENAIRNALAGNPNLYSGVEIEVVFFETSIVECIKRDEIRGIQGKRFTGKKVIRQMYREYFQPIYEAKRERRRPNDASLPTCTCFDMDGTLAIMNGRSPYDASTCERDLPNPPVVQAAKQSSQNGYTIIVSAREEKDRVPTENWLKKQGIPFTNLFMRVTGDGREDSIVKKEIYERDILPFYNIFCVYDDRSRVVNMLREDLGLTVFQVAEGDF